MTSAASTQSYALNVNDVRHSALAAGWNETRHNETTRVLSFNKWRARIDVYYTTGCVASILRHPRGGKNQLFRKPLSMSELQDVFANPRAHTGKGYRSNKANLLRREAQAVGKSKSLEAGMVLGVDAMSQLAGNTVAELYASLLKRNEPSDDDPYYRRLETDWLGNELWRELPLRRDTSAVQDCVHCGRQLFSLADTRTADCVHLTCGHLACQSCVQQGDQVKWFVNGGKLCMCARCRYGSTIVVNHPSRFSKTRDVAALLEDTLLSSGLRGMPLGQLWDQSLARLSNDLMSQLHKLAEFEGGMEMMLLRATRDLLFPPCTREASFDWDHTGFIPMLEFAISPPCAVFVGGFVSPFFGAVSEDDNGRNSFIFVKDGPYVVYR